MLGAHRLAHLLARLLDALSARGLTGLERVEVLARLRNHEVDAFFEQPKADQRHGHHAARAAAAETSDPIMVRAALLHDIGKRHAHLGVIGRSLATAWEDIGGRGRGRWLIYHRHGELGADELARLGAEPMVVEFARHHHGGRPPSIDAQSWDLLVRADRARLPIADYR